MILIGFVILFLIYWSLFELGEYIADNYYSNGSRKFNKIFGLLLNSFQFTLVFIFLTTVILQFSYPKKLLRPHLIGSPTFRVTQTILLTVVNRKFVNGIINANSTGIGLKEIIIQTITDKTFLDKIQKSLD